MNFEKVAEMCFKVNSVFYKTNHKWSDLGFKERIDYSKIVESFFKTLNR